MVFRFHSHVLFVLMPLGYLRFPFLKRYYQKASSMYLSDRLFMQGHGLFMALPGRVIALRASRVQIRDSRRVEAGHSGEKYSKIAVRDISTRKIDTNLYAISV